MNADRNTNLPDQFREFIRQNHLFTQQDRLLIAVSGGLDSVVLCELCRESGYHFDIAHCNFQLRGDESMGDEDFVKSLSSRYEARVYVRRFELGVTASQKTAVQEKARELRYHWFEELMRKEPGRYHSLLTAHHAGDQAETLLMNFLKGTGIAGLQGIQPDQAFNGISHLQRPLLFATKGMLLDFAKARNLPCRNDTSNNSNDYTRNFIRNEILPAIASRIPSVEMNLINNIARFRDVNELYHLALRDVKKNLLEKSGQEYRVPVLKLQKSPALATLIYELFRDFGFKPAQGADLLSLLTAHTGKYVLSSTHRVLRNRAWLIISTLDPGGQSQFIVDHPGTVLNFPGGRLQVGSPEPTATIEPHPLIACVNAGSLDFPLILRKWRQGDYFYPLGMRKKKKLSRFFIDQKMSMTEKENTWVLESSKKIAWVLGRRIDERFKITPSATAVIKIKLTPAK